MNRVEKSLAILGAGCAMISPNFAEAFSPPVVRPETLPATIPGLISPSQADTCVREALGYESDGDLANPVVSVGFDFPKFSTHPRLLRIMHIFGTEVENSCEADVIASRITRVLPMFQTKRGNYISAATQNIVFSQYANKSLTGLDAENLNSPKTELVRTEKIYPRRKILIKVWSIAETKDGKQYPSSGIMVIKPDGATIKGAMPKK